MLPTIKRLIRDGDVGLVSFDALWLALGRPNVASMLSEVDSLYRSGAVSLRWSDCAGARITMTREGQDGRLWAITLRR